jgi:hypothetical protein
MFLFPRSCPVARSTATRFSRRIRSVVHPSSIAKGLGIHSRSAQQVESSASFFVLHRPASSWPSVGRRRGVDRQLPYQNARSINIDALRESIPGSEPGINIKDEDAWPQWKNSIQSQITVVDFSSDRVEKYELNNSTLAEFLAKPREDWVTCRWFNINGLSSDVVKMLGEKQQLHSLAIEDLLHTRNRTKADWYPEHVFGMFITPPEFMPS